MKPTSIIFLVLSVILIAGGAITCMTAQKMAEVNGIDLFYQPMDEGENGVETYPFSSNTVHKITLRVGDADVVVSGGAENSYMQVVNFPKNTYEYSVSNKNMTIDDSVSLMNLFRVTSGGLEFSGLRYYIYYDRFEDKRKVVYVYVAESEQITHLDITVESGNITIGNLDMQLDYSIKIGKGNLEMDAVSAVSSLTAHIGEGNADIACGGNKGEYDIVIDTGNLNVSLEENGVRSYHLVAPEGIIDYFGDKKGVIFEIEPMTVYSSFRAELSNGNLTLVRKTNPPADPKS